jgi:hypothetical protein
MAEFWKSTHQAKSAAELDAAIQRVLGRIGLMLFVEFDHGMIVRKGTERPTANIIRLVIGNSSHHERNGEACSGRRLVCSGYRPCG